MDRVAYVKSVMSRLEPINPDCDSAIVSLSNVKVVVFDIYGTLLISAAGDIGLLREEGQTGRSAMGQVLKSLSMHGTVDPAHLESRFRAVLGEMQEQKRSAGIAFPEVDIREVWNTLLSESGVAFTETMLDEFALRYECAVNPVWEMPGAVDTIRRFRDHGFKLGIVSNAQHYTHDVAAGVLGGTFQELGFEESLMQFSYRSGEGKPSLLMYQKMRSQLAAFGLAPETVVYVGNDMAKDIVPAAEVGFRTVLFAGDRRSLRLGDFSFEEAASIADAVVTQLSQLSDIVRL